ncbi:type II restriction endonuclease [Symbiopectobacterium sp. RP]|uniref:EcoRII-C domain-containing protein n=1 Tax=Rhodnius prolixus TaxID=13249 RepID=T1I3N5_RHOPR
MKSGYLSDYFEGVAAKRLRSVEVDTRCSNQHEYNATKAMEKFLGRPGKKVQIPARFIYLNDDDAGPLVEDAYLTYGDRRAGTVDNRTGKPRSEYRLYFPTTNVSLNSSEGDLLVIAKKRDGNLIVIVAENGSSIGRQIEWLFGFSKLNHPGFSARSELETEQDRIAFSARVVLENIGIVVESRTDSCLDEMLEKFPAGFPSTREFSAYARSTLADIHPIDNPDSVLMTWMEREEILFRTLERYLIADKLSKGFSPKGNGIVDTDGFLQFSLSVQNRRKSRVGLALENHLEIIFKENGIRYSRGVVTENRCKPDFLFPSIVEYRDPDFAHFNLTMLGVKSTCKDRWRQILSEASRIPAKHLLTLQPSISENQTKEMATENVQLVVPALLHSTYSSEQQKWLKDLNTFILMVREKQSGSALLNK